ncbi:uncharacterized protein LOC115218577 [Octopus sinensis]|uniref:Uncharacterized protein LOC115218577 n=1 Tax=Octopus sinensis TaxID=2607531 RepID=A0A6P7T0U5_9MOLL|nr:uncharacterized protein LOC115218577 [Octopus sinensis]
MPVFDVELLLEKENGSNFKILIGEISDLSSARLQYLTKKKGWFELKAEFRGCIALRFVPDIHAVNAYIWTQQQQQVYDALKACYLRLVNGRCALLQHENVPADTANVTKCKLLEFKKLEVMPQPIYSPVLAPLDYYFCRAMAHFLHGQGFISVNEVGNGCQKIFPQNTAKWNKCGIGLLVERWQKTIEIWCDIIW